MHPSTARPRLGRLRTADGGRPRRRRSLDALGAPGRIWKCSVRIDHRGNRRRGRLHRRGRRVVAWGVAQRIPRYAVAIKMAVNAAMTSTIPGHNRGVPFTCSDGVAVSDLNSPRFARLTPEWCGNKSAIRVSMLVPARGLFLEAPANDGFEAFGDCNARRRGEARHIARDVDDGGGMGSIEGNCP